MKLKIFIIIIFIIIIGMYITCTGNSEEVVSDNNTTEEELGEMIIHTEDIGMFSCAAKVSMIKAEGKALDFTLMDTEGNEVSLSDYNGKYVHLDFSVEWCPVCANQSGYLSNLDILMEGKDFVSLTILFQNEEAQPATVDDAKEWAELYSISDVLIGNEELAKEYIVNYTPTNYIIAPNMEILGGWSGSTDIEVFMENLEQLAPELFQ
jgi:peroxiredoxin